MRLVSTVTSTRCAFFAQSLHSAIRSSTCFSTGRMITVGSISPVGRITCSMKMPCVRSISHGPGVALTNVVCGRSASHSSNFSGRLSIAEGRRKPNSASTLLRLKSPRNMPPICGTVTWLSSTDQQRVLGEVLEQRGRRLARLAAGEVARIVLDAGAGAGRLHHLDVEDGALLQPLRLEQAAGAVELVEPLLEVGLYLLDRLLHRRLAASRSGCWRRR